MKKILFSTMLLSAVVQLSAQTTIFEENFNGNYPGYNLPTGWTRVDRDGLSNTQYCKWETTKDPTYNALGFTGGVVIAVIKPTSDDMFISPSITLPAGNTYSLTYLVGLYDGFQQIAGNSHYGVYVLPEGTSFTGTETPIFEESLNGRTNASARTINLSAYAGQVVKVYFRDFNSVASSTFLLFDDIKVTQQPTLGTSDVKQETSIGIYPNPTSDYVYLKSKSKITKAEVFDAAGRKLEASFNDNRLDIKNLQPGTYMVRFTESNKTYSQKIIKK